MSKSHLLERSYDGIKSTLDRVKDYSCTDHLRKIVELMYTSLAPASASPSNHGAFDGGLLCHTYVVMKLMMGITSALVCEHRSLQGFEGVAFLNSTPSAKLSELDVITVSILHDLNKLQTLDGQPYYIPNMIKNGTVRSEAKPWEVNKIKKPMGVLTENILPSHSWAGPIGESEGIIIREGVLSLAVAEKISPGIYGLLSEKQRNAVIYHDGAYAGRSGLQGKESTLQQVLHTADMLASRFYC